MPSIRAAASLPFGTLHPPTKASVHRLGGCCYNGCTLRRGEDAAITLDQFISLAEAATRKGVHYLTVRSAVARGDLRAVKVGGGVMIASDDLDA